MRTFRVVDLHGETREAQESSFAEIFRPLLPSLLGGSLQMSYRIKGCRTKPLIVAGAQTHLHSPHFRRSYGIYLFVTIQHVDNGAGESPPPGAIKFPDAAKHPNET